MHFSYKNFRNFSAFFFLGSHLIYSQTWLSMNMFVSQYHSCHSWLHFGGKKLVFDNKLQHFLDSLFLLFQWTQTHRMYYTMYLYHAKGLFSWLGIFWAKNLLFPIKLQCFISSSFLGIDSPYWQGTCIWWVSIRLETHFLDWVHFIPKKYNFTK